MKKVFKTIGLIVLIILVIGLLAIKFFANRPAAPDNYQQTVSTEGRIEQKYMKNGPYEVALREDPVLQSFKKFIVYYPSNLEEENKKFPVIVLCNGCRTDFADIQNKKECGGNRQWQRQFLRKWAANTKGKAII